MRLRGVTAVTSGYAGGTTPNPTYEQVSGGRTGHAEVIRVEYDPQIIPFRKLLEVFFMAHDPTTPNRQGADIGSQYRSIILYTDEGQKLEAERYITELTAAKRYANSIVTALEPLGVFYPAEGYHQDFYTKNPDQPYAEAVITPKVEKLTREHPELLK